MMNSGSAELCPNSKFPQKQTFLSKQFELPLFLYKKFLITKSTEEQCRYRKILQKQMVNYDKYYNNKAITEIPKYKLKKDSEPKAANKNPTFLSRRYPSQRTNLALAPNRYTIKVKGYNLSDIIDKKTGLKGPYACFTGKRDNSTIYGKIAANLCTPSTNANFYNLPNDMDRLNHPRNYFIMKIRDAPRANQKLGIRIMLNDLTLCYKVPNEPGPADYLPENYCIKIIPSRKQSQIRKPVAFYPNSIVPINERFKLERRFQPGPGRYTPQPIVCHGPKKSYVFASTTKRLLDKPKNVVKHNKASTRIFDHDPDYWKMIKKPKRTDRFSYQNEAFLQTQYKDRVFRFNSTDRPMKRSKARSNKRICFMSGVPRFKNDNLNIFDRLPNKLKHKTKEPPKIDFSKREVKLKELKPLDRLTKLPKRFLENMPKRKNSDKMTNVFPFLPKPKILVP